MGDAVDDRSMSWEELKLRSYCGRPHVVILGAGASLAAFPSGDANGRKLPLMQNLVETLDLAGVLSEHHVSPDGNFEDVYGGIAFDPGLAELRQVVDDRVSEYFASLRIPEAPTIYDYLVLSLRGKDCIATFNWDPFLQMAFWRNGRVVEPPTILYLHGCAIVGCCMQHKTMGSIRSRCPQCGELFTPTRLLYPVRDKDYPSDGFISAQWKQLQLAMEHAWVVTVFGYSAPVSDAAAIDLLSEAWGSADKRNLEEIEIIDIRPEQELASSWKRFIHTHHYRTTNDYFSSLLGTFPRRTCEAMWEQNMEARFLEYQSVPQFSTLAALQEWVVEIAALEKRST